EEAWGLVREPAFDLRQGIILEDDLPLDPTLNPEQPDSLTITRFDPEAIDIAVSLPRAGMLSLALPHFPPWHVQVDDEDAPLLRAYGGLSAVYLAEGQHRVSLRYSSTWLKLGGVLSVIAWLVVGLVGITAPLKKFQIRR